MKTRILHLLLFTACLSIVPSCCEDECPASTVDILGRLTKAAIHGDYSWQDPVGFQVGGDLPLTYFNNEFSLRGGAMVSLQGANWKEGSLEGKTSLWYAYIPAVIRFQHKSGFFGEAGLQPGFLLSAKDKYEGTSESYMDHMNRFDLSVPVAIGYKFKNNFGIDFRVIPGITDITKDEEVKDVNFVMGLGVTYTFDLKK